MEKKVKIAEYKYVYDPNHTSKPAGNWNRTNSGWSSNTTEYDHKPVKPYKPTVQQQKTTQPIEQEEKDVDLFDEQETDFETNEAQKEEPIVVEEESDEEESNLDGEQPNLDEEEPNLDEQEENNVTEEEQSNLKEEQEVDLDQEESFFTDAQKENFLNEEKFDAYIEKMNTFITTFDEDEGKENKVTFKAVASNLDWSIEDDAKAFANHCKKQNLNGAEEIIAFLYYQYANDKDKFETILEKMN